MLSEAGRRRIKLQGGTPVVKKALAEQRDFGRQVGVVFEYECEGNDSASEAWLLSFDVAEQLMDAMWLAGCRPRQIDQQLMAIRTLMLGPKYRG